MHSCNLLGKIWTWSWKEDGSFYKLITLNISLCHTSLFNSMGKQVAGPAFSPFVWFQWTPVDKGLQFSFCYYKIWTVPTKLTWRWSDIVSKVFKERVILNDTVWQMRTRGLQGWRKGLKVYLCKGETRTCNIEKTQPPLVVLGLSQEYFKFKVC